MIYLQRSNARYFHCAARAARPWPTGRCTCLLLRSTATTRHFSHAFPGGAMPDDIDMLQCQVRFLETENRTLRQNLRDEFAKAALTGYLASYEPLDDPIEYSKSIAGDCYVLADAMLEARKS